MENNHLILEFKFFKKAISKLNKWLNDDEQEASSNADVKRPIPGTRTYPDKEEVKVSATDAYRNLKALKGLLDNMKDIYTHQENEDKKKYDKKEQNNRDKARLRREKPKYDENVSKLEELKAEKRELTRKKSAKIRAGEPYANIVNMLREINVRIRKLSEKIKNYEELKEKTERVDRELASVNEASRSSETNTRLGQSSNVKMSEQEQIPAKVLDNIKKALNIIVDESTIRALLRDQEADGVHVDSLEASNSLDLPFLNTLLTNTQGFKNEVVELYEILGEYLKKGGKYTATMPRPNRITEGLSPELKLKRNKNGIAKNLALFASKVYQIEDDASLYGHFGAFGKHLKDFNKTLKDMYGKFYWE